MGWTGETDGCTGIDIPASAHPELARRKRLAKCPSARSSGTTGTNSATLRGFEPPSSGLTIRRSPTELQGQVQLFHRSPHSAFPEAANPADASQHDSERVARVSVSLTHVSVARCWDER